MNKEKSIFKNTLMKFCLTLFLSTIVMSISGVASTALAAPPKNKKMLVIYYSWGGNTKYMAEQIQSLTGADIFELKTATPYPTEYRLTVAQARQELASGYRPPLSSKINNLASYDIIFIGSPNWLGTLAMPFFTFLEKHDMAGKTLVPFMTHERSGFGKTLADLKTLCPKANMLEGLAVRGSNVKESQPEISSWLKKIGMLR